MSEHHKLSFNMVVILWKLFYRFDAQGREHNDYERYSGVVGGEEGHWKKNMKVTVRAM